MPKFLEKENLKWIEEIENGDGSITYKAKEDAPKEIKKEVKRSKKNHI